MIRFVFLAWALSLSLALARPAWSWDADGHRFVCTPATGYLGNPGNLAFGEIYVRQNQLAVLRRLSQAGVRLGLMLNRIFAG